MTAAPEAHDLATFWDSIHRDRHDNVSWYQERPSTSLELLDRCGTRPEHSVVDVGAGSSRLVDELLLRGHQDLTVLDASAEALSQSRSRLGPAAETVNWATTDVLSWTAGRHFDAWHDRAALHFLVEDSQVRRYVRQVRRHVRPGGILVVATFARGGPEQCSGLPVRRYDPGDIAALFASDFRQAVARNEEHRTPWGTAQPFSWAALVRTGNVHAGNA